MTLPIRSLAGGPLRSHPVMVVRVLAVGVVMATVSCGPSGTDVDPVEVTTTSLPDGVVSVAYASVALAATGGSGTPAWSIVAGTLPPGVTLSVAGELAGTPTTAGAFDFTVEVAAGGATDRAQLAITVHELLEVATTSLPEAVEGMDYGSEAVVATGGVGGYAWTVASGALPSGMSLSGAGAITGEPTEAGAFDFTVEVTSGTQTAQRELSLTVLATLVITTTDLPDAVEDTPYGPESLTATGGEGAYAWAITVGGLPPGVTLSPAGVLSGTPTATGAFDFTVEVASGTQTDAAGLSIEVAPRLFDVSVEIQSFFWGGTITGDVGPVIDCSSVLQPLTGTFATEGTCEGQYPDGTVLTLTTSGSVFTFGGWDVPGCTPAEQPPTDPCTFTVTEDRVVSVAFNIDSAPPVLGVFGAGDGDGSVDGQVGLVPAVVCAIEDGVGPASCESPGAGFAYPPGTIVTLTPSAGSGSGFVGWEDMGTAPLQGCTTPVLCTLTMGNSHQVYARFVEGTVSRFLTIGPPVLPPAEQATSPVTVSTRVADQNGVGVVGAAVIFSSPNGCFDWQQPLEGSPRETVVYSTAGGSVQATGTACVTIPGPGADPTFQVRLAGTTQPLGFYRVAVADDLPSSATITEWSGDNQSIACGEVPAMFEARVTDGGSAVPDAPVTWVFGNTFARRADSNGISREGYGEAPFCNFTHTVTARIETTSGQESVQFSVTVGPGPGAPPGAPLAGAGAMAVGGGAAPRPMR